MRRPPRSGQHSIDGHLQNLHYCLLAAAFALDWGTACSSPPLAPVTDVGGTGGSEAAAGGGSNAGGAPGAGTGGTPWSGGGIGGSTAGSLGTGGASPEETGIAYYDGTSRLSGLPKIDCHTDVASAEISPAIATVGIVNFSSNLPNLTAAEVHFGKDLTYGLVAPVDLKEPGYRTLLLGMVQNSIYHFRVAVSDGTSVCYGEDRTIQTGSLDTRAKIEGSTSEAAAPGFIVTSSDSGALIFNKEGELVWAFPMMNVFSVHMSWDGKHMLGRDSGPFDSGYGGTFFRVNMDGSDGTTLDAHGGDHHDFTAIPGGIAYIAKSEAGGCDLVYEASNDITDGLPVFDTWQIYQYFPDEGDVEGTEICHANRIHYSLEKDWYTLSDRNKDALAVFSKRGTPVTSIGKTPQGNWTKHIQAEGAGLDGIWHVQHGHHFYADNKLLVFSNEPSGGSALLHYTITGNTASLDWKYTGAGDSRIQGDAQRLPNGNFLVTSSNNGLMVELGPDGQTTVAEYSAGAMVGFAYGFQYTDHRPSLYGSPASR